MHACSNSAHVHASVLPKLLIIVCMGRRHPCYSTIMTGHCTIVCMGRRHPCYSTIMTGHCTIVCMGRRHPCYSTIMTGHCTIVCMGRRHPCYSTIMTGHCTGSVLRRWKWNWFVLYRDGVLRYFESEDSPRAEEVYVLRSVCVRVKTGAEVCAHVTCCCCRSVV